MKPTVLLSCLLLAGCALRHDPPPRVPPAEAAWFKFPDDLPADGRREVPAATAAAIQLAMDDFRPRHLRMPGDASAVEICLNQRQSYDVRTAPAAAGILLVRFSVSPGACMQEGAVNDMGATYAVDTQAWRILAVQLP
ncbi:hypothetical protein [Comamonas sp. JC664]|uniref:hypothetical protein n=1 Tax=Comamonas sp. JC664 TaxID=2801917 RepID=UPI001748747A|nr:hypothetical protein [Comamonas sp. JC664]MBL0698362.1 hypothetical protein [Comamonas sp. JC664]GHG89827.1 hypothetical protein GCM10012319_49530 [Comamonas sp. KCTC 72670]